MFDGYFEQALGPWDVAAGALLVREAGGVVTDWAGTPTRGSVSGDILAAPPAVHAGLLEITRPPSSEPPENRAHGIRLRSGAGSPNNRLTHPHWV